MPKVDVDIAFDVSGEELVVAKFSDAHWELNVWARAQDFLSLREIRTMDWNSRGAAKIGTAAGAAVFWCANGEVATIMVGSDDETWDVAMSIPVAVVDDLVGQVANL